MKKALLLCGIAALTLASCNSANKNQSSADTQDEASEFTSPDLSTFELKGHVKSVTETSDVNPDLNKVIEFSTDGVATIKSYWGCDGKIGRDDQGRIATIGTVIDEMQDGSFFTIHYADDGKVAAIITETPSYYMAFPEEYGSYNEQGWPTSMTCEGGEGGYVLRQEYTYSYPEIDQYGNWTVKIGQGTDTEIEMDDEPVVTENKVKYTRTITYYTPDELGK